MIDWACNPTAPITASKASQTENLVLVLVLVLVLETIRTPERKVDSTNPAVVGRATPCAPSPLQVSGAHGVTRPTCSRQCHVAVDSDALDLAQPGNGTPSPIRPVLRSPDPIGTESGWVRVV